MTLTLLLAACVVVLILAVALGVGLTQWVNHLIERERQAEARRWRNEL
ncbi:hypothetical protein [Sediminicoccus sp. KRV36]|nr:hypothetical protein [Sediminicoccus rosea]UPY35508.1 hypothetical protein LHU95_14915 [Sediminicoccus rosea]